MRKNLRFVFPAIILAIFATKSYALDNLLSGATGGITDAATNMQGVAKGAATDLAVEEVKGLVGDFLTPKVRSRSKSNVDAQDIEDAKHKADEIRATYDAKGKKEEEALTQKKSAAQLEAEQLELKRKERVEKRAKEAEQRRLEEEARKEEEAKEEARLIAEEEVKQKAIEAEIEKAAQEAARKVKKRAAELQVVKDLATIKEEIVKLGTELAAKEKELGDANVMITALKAKIEEMKAKEIEINKNIIASNKAEEKLLRQWIANSSNTAKKPKSAAAIQKRAGGKKRKGVGALDPSIGIFARKIETAGTASAN
ncbi:MAG: hypothetical protein K2Q34_04355 [Alphaproteobacteria bacterium]|nr:hypothetical protein [Alphaproteobacteria bacterium]